MGEKDDLNCIVIHARDNVAVARADIEAGGAVRPRPGESFPALERIPCGHKVALVGIGMGEPVCKYGEIIGYATVDIAPGALVHTHNLKGDEP